MDITIISKVILENDFKNGKLTPLIVKNGIKKK